MITIEQPKVKGIAHLRDFEVGGTFIHKGCYYIATEHVDEEEEIAGAATNLLNGTIRVAAFFDHGNELLYAVDLVMRVVETGT